MRTSTRQYELVQDRFLLRMGLYSGEVFTAWLHDESCDETPLSLDHSVAAQPLARPKPDSKRGNGWCRGVWGHIQMMNIYTPLFIKQNCFIWSLLSDDNE